MRQTEDELMRNMLAATAGFINCTGGVNGDNPTEISAADVDTVVGTLLGNNAFTITDGIEGMNKFGTAPVRNAYFALCHTALQGNLASVNNFLHAWNYPKQEALPSEWGNIANLRFLISSIGSISQNASLLGANVYNIFCTGLQAYAAIELEGGNASFIYRDPMYDGALALNSTCAWKFAEAVRILNDQWIINLRTTLA